MWLRVGRRQSIRIRELLDYTVQRHDFGTSSQYSYLTLSIPEAANGVICDVAVVSLEKRAKFGDSRSKRFWDMRPSTLWSMTTKNVNWRSWQHKAKTPSEVAPKGIQWGANRNSGVDYWIEVSSTHQLHPKTRWLENPFQISEKWSNTSKGCIQEKTTGGCEVMSWTIITVFLSIFINCSRKILWWALVFQNTLVTPGEWEQTCSATSLTDLMLVP